MESTRLAERGEQGDKWGRSDFSDSPTRERGDILFPEPVAQGEGAALIERVVSINRVAKVVQGGRNFNFNALVVVGDGKGQVGVAVGKAREISDAITKATEAAKLNKKSYPLIRGTIPHAVFSKFKSAKVVLKPASPGTGIIAGGAARAVLECWGATDVLCKSLGSNNPINVAYATIRALQMLEDARMVAKRRGIPIRKLLRLPSEG